MALGYDTKGVPIGNWAVGVNSTLFNFQAEIRPSLTRKVDMNNLFGFRLSANLIDPSVSGISILPGFGYYYNHRSSDKVILNKWQTGYSLKTMKDFTENGSAFIEGFYSSSFQLTIGMQVNFR